MEKYAIAIDGNGTPTRIDIVTDDKLKEYVCVKKIGQNTPTTHYKKVDIFWPIPMLKVKSILFLPHHSLTVFSCVYVSFTCML